MIANFEPGKPETSAVGSRGILLLFKLAIIRVILFKLRLQPRLRRVRNSVLPSGSISVFDRWIEIGVQWRNWCSNSDGSKFFLRSNKWIGARENPREVT